MKAGRKIFFVFFVLFIINLSACNISETDIIIGGSNSSNDSLLSAWIVYWDIDSGIKEFSKTADKLSSVSSFTLCFKNDGSIYTFDSFNEKYNKISDIARKNNVDLYVCVVNNVADENGNISQNNSNIIRNILNKPEKRAEHINEIISFVSSNNYFGIEIDYGKIDDNVWPDFAAFCRELYQKCIEEKLGLRIILEPKAPLDRYSLPNGPEYIMKAYNLHDSSTEPGPKADIHFIRQLSEKMSNLSGKKWFAFSSGGFDWQTNGQTKSITESEALDIISVYKCLPARDEKSGCLYFYYIDENGNDHTVWYADDTSFALWLEAAKESNYSNVCFWRFGGNASTTLDKFKQNFIK